MTHAWVQAPLNDWGCTAVVAKGDRAGEQCGAPAIIACLGRSGDCDGNEGRCRDHIRGDEFRKPYLPLRRCRYCRSATHFGDRCKSNPWNRAKRKSRSVHPETPPTRGGS